MTGKFTNRHFVPIHIVNLIHFLGMVVWAPQFGHVFGHRLLKMPGTIECHVEQHSP